MSFLHLKDSFLKYSREKDKGSIETTKNLEKKQVVSQNLTYSKDIFVLSKFANFIMKNGEKATAEKTLEQTLCLLAKKGLSMGLAGKSSIEIITEAVRNVQPAFELRKARISGTTQFIPSILHPEKQENIGIRWILLFAREKKRRSQKMKNREYSFVYFLAQELLEAAKKQGNARQKRDEIHKLAEANRALAYQRWW